MEILIIKSVFILVVLVFSAIHCQDGKKSQTEVSDNHNSNVSIVINNVTETPFDVTTLPDETPTTTAPNNTTVTPSTTQEPITTVTTPTTPTTKSTPSTTSATTPTTPTTSPKTTTTLAPSTSTTVTPATSAKPVDPTTTPAPHKDRHFDGASFIGGIILAVGLMGIAFIAFKFYKARTERNYHTL